MGTVCIPESGTDRVLLEHFAYQANKHTKSDQEISISGTGEKAFMRMLPDLLSQAPPPNDKVERLFWAEIFGLGMAAQLIGQEIMTGSNLLDWWGGGIEVATYEDDKFVKHGNVLHTFWHRNLSSSNAAIELVPKFIKYDYFQDALVIQKFESEFTDEGKASVKAHDYRVYTPLLKSRHDYDFSRFPFYDLSYTTLNCYVRVEENQSDLWAYVKTFRGHHLFEVELEEEGLRISIKKDLVDALIDETKQTPNSPEAI
jgi:hypothetical protein